MSQELATMMFDMLNRRIGEEVFCKIWQNGVVDIVEGTLNNVVPFDTVNIDNRILPFIGEGISIDTIMEKKEKGKNIYVNRKAEEYSYINGTFELIQAQKEALGYSVRMEALQNTRVAGKRR